MEACKACDENFLGESAMPMNKKMMKNMMDEYGSEKGKRVYYATENKQRSKKGRKPSGRSRSR